MSWMEDAIQGMVDSIIWLLWMVGASILYFVEDAYQALILIPSSINLFFEATFVDSGISDMVILATALCGIMLLIAIISSLSNNENLFRAIKNIFIVLVVTSSLGIIFQQATDLTVKLSAASSNMFTTTDNDSLGLMLANQMIYLKDDIPDEYLDVETYPDDPYTDMADINEKDIIAARYQTNDDEWHYYYSFYNPILSFTLLTIYFFALLLNGFMLFGHVFEVIYMKLLAPIIMVMKLSTTSFGDQSFKNYFVQLGKSFGVISLQFISTFFGIALAMFGANLDIAKNILVLIFILGASVLIMFNGPDTIVKLFGFDVGINGIAQSWALAKGAQVLGKGVSVTLGTLKDGADKVADVSGVKDFASGVNSGFKQSYTGEKVKSTVESAQDAKGSYDDFMYRAGETIGQGVINPTNNMINNDFDELSEMYNTGYDSNVNMSESDYDNLNNVDNNVDFHNMDNSHDINHDHNDIKHMSESNGAEPTQKQENMAKHLGVDISGQNATEAYDTISKAMNNSDTYKNPTFEKSNLDDNEQFDLQKVIDNSYSNQASGSEHNDNTNTINKSTSDVRVDGSNNEVHNHITNNYHNDGETGKGGLDG